MKTFQEFMSICEASDADAAKQLGWGGGASIKKTGEGGRIGRERKKTTPERRRMRAVGGGKMEPVDYKPRKDIGQQRTASERQQQPEQERGSAEVKQSYAEKVKAERRAAAQARIAAKKGGGEAPSAAKPKAKEASATATKLLSKKKEEKPAHPDYKPQQASGMTRAERDRARNKAKSEMLKQRKAKLFADFKETHGRSPTAKERTKLLGLAHQSMKG